MVMCLPNWWSCASLTDGQILLAVIVIWLLFLSQVADVIEMFWKVLLLRIVLFYMPVELRNCSGVYDAWLFSGLVSYSTEVVRL